MFVLGERDKFISMKSLKLASKMYPKMRIEKLPKASHFLQHHAAKATNNLIRDFLGPSTDFTIETRKWFFSTQPWFQTEYPIGPTSFANRCCSFLLLAPLPMIYLPCHYRWLYRLNSYVIFLKVLIKNKASTNFKWTEYKTEFIGEFLFQEKKICYLF